MTAGWRQKLERVLTPGVNVRARRIVDTAIELAEKGGFEAVRLRDVAAEADVALGTLYRYFRSKEDLLIAALTSEVEQLENRMLAKPAPGDTPFDRVTTFFRTATKGLVRRPRFSRAILRAAASGDHELAEKVAAFHNRMTDMILAAMHGDDSGAASSAGAANGSNGGTPPAPQATVDERAVADVLQHVWFSCLIGWGGGLMSPNQVIDQMSSASSILMRGVREG